MKRLIQLSIFVILMVSCAPQMMSTWDKPNYTAPVQDKILVMAISNNLQVRQSLENEIVAALKEKLPNKSYVTGLTIFPPNIDLSKISEAQIEEKVKSYQPTAVLTSCIINNYESSEYNMSEPTYIPRYFRYGRYVYRSYEVINTPGYYSTNQNFVLESNLFDAKEGNNPEEAMVWKGQSEITNPSSVASGARSYAKNLVNYLVSQQKIK